MADLYLWPSRLAIIVPPWEFGPTLISYCTHHRTSNFPQTAPIIGSWFEGSFTVDVSESKPNRPNTMNLVEKWAQELGLCEDSVNGRAGLLGSGTIKGVEEG